MPELETPVFKTRRVFEPDLKRELVLRSLEPGASVAGIAMSQGVNANLLFKWRRQHLYALAAAAGQCGPAVGAQAVLLPVSVSTKPTSTTIKAKHSTRQIRQPGGVIEIELGSCRLRLHGAVDDATLVCALRTLHLLA
jgi:transposase